MVVNVTIYIEGVYSENPSVLTVDNTAVFRESFYKLLSQKLSPANFKLIIQPFGTITQTKKYLELIEKQQSNAVILIDLDGPKEKIPERLVRYQLLDTARIFFMIQEMEAWILSQVDKIEEFGKREGLTRKKEDQDMGSNPLIKNKHPEEIEKPSEKLKTLFGQYFESVKVVRGQQKIKKKQYSKAKDGPKLIGLLDLERLMQDFDEVERLIDYIGSIEGEG
ncbi:DUF4276 family protein [Oscillatoria acuminata]|uniref:DUF4276 domain-containing protein n=1 Tax=Oscillatoria acuminata PCC 6304 TaxID=56110 RepID=K9TKW6_9CYAN|nr:DUF4276 family protein [Oscillatoria acuminata]AFY83185.1 hypothetical protein Oscil6304_3622 [Oscillatoria acuminata PCC 6304]